MAMANSNLKIILNIKVNFKTMKSMVKVNSFGKMEGDIKANEKIIKRKALDCIPTQMEENIMENIKII